LNIPKKIHYSNSTDIPLNIETLEKMAELTAAELGHPEKELSLALVSDAEIQELNRRYRSRNSVTDVLSFPVEEPQVPFLGDIVIDIYQAERQKGHRSLLEEIQQLFLHGLLHLYGFDHIAAKDKKDMESLEKRISIKAKEI